VKDSDSRKSSSSREAPVTRTVSPRRSGSSPVLFPSGRKPIPCWAVPRMRKQKAVARNRPLLNRGVSFGNYNQPIPARHCGRAAIRRSAGFGRGSRVGAARIVREQEERAESIVASRRCIRSSVALPRIQIEIRARFFENGRRGTDPSRIGKSGRAGSFRPRPR